jgi:hypothetical protein
MNCVLGSAVVVAVGLSMAFVSPAAAQQTAPIAPNENIVINYMPPKTAALMGVYERLKSCDVLETLQQFLAPLKLSRPLEVRFEECGTATVPYKPNGPATVCYEYVDQIENNAPKVPKVTLTSSPGRPEESSVITKASAIIGPVVQAVLHQAALAVFDNLNIPIWGRRDDAADRVAAFLMLQFGPDVAWETIAGTAWFLAASTGAPVNFADARGAIAQRYYTTLCMAIGWEYTSRKASEEPKFRYYFAQPRTSGALPAQRVANCPKEYETLKRGFDALFVPHITSSLLERVRSQETWLKSGACQLGK